MNPIRLLPAVILLASASACYVESAPPVEELSITCTGKCDGPSAIDAIISDPKSVELGDLLVAGAELATEQLNDQLAFGDFAAIEIEPTAVYGTSSAADAKLSVQDLDELVSGLAAHFGERELTTEVNAIRADHLRHGGAGDQVFAESAFRLSAGLDHDWRHLARGFGGPDELDLTIDLGFEAGGDLEARVIGAYPSAARALGGSPLHAMREMRGFVLPRDVGDIRAMRPGESFALSGEGRLGMNLGLGVPLLIADPTSFASYRLALTAALRTLLEGDMDVQLIRLRDDEVVVDVGLSSARLRSASLGITDGWGVSGLIDLEFSVGPVDVDVGRLAERALENRLNRQLGVINGGVSRVTERARVSVARLRFNLDGPDPLGAREQALKQALAADVRLAQALAARGDSGVEAEFDLLRSGMSSAGYAGVQIFGMHFFRRSVESEGSVVIQTPGGAQSLLFDSLREESGRFFTSRGITRVGLAGLRFDARGGAPRGETNLFLQVDEGQRYMDRDALIDHLDAVILGVAGAEAVAALNEHGNELERYVLETCPVPDNTFPDDEPRETFSEACQLELLDTDPVVAELREGGMDAVSGRLVGLSPAAEELVLEAARLRLAAQSIADPNDVAAGPRGAVAVDLRLDDAALKQVMARPGRDLEAALIDILRATQVDRTSPDYLDDQDEIAARAAAVATRMRGAFDSHRADYLALAGVETATIERLGDIGARAVEVSFSVDAAGRPVYEEAITRSLAQARSEVVTSLFDELRAQAGDFRSYRWGGRPPHPGHSVAYALLRLAEPDRQDLRLSVSIDTSGGFFSLPKERYDVAGVRSSERYAQGEQVQLVGGGMFDVDALLDLE